FVHVSGRTLPEGSYTRAIGHQATNLNRFLEAMTVWQPIFAGKIHEHFPTSILVCAGIDKKRIYPARSDESQSSFIIIRCVRRQNNREAQLLCRNLYPLAPWPLPLLYPTEACYAACTRQHLFEQSKALRIDLRIKQMDVPGDISPRFCQAADE